MLKELLYKIVEWIARFHSYFLRLNDAFEYNFSDKELHFLVIGVIGMVCIFVVYPIFKWLAKRNHIMVISWIYVFTLIIVLTFAIEIGQKVTNTGAMEFADIVFGVVGFMFMFLIFAMFREIWHLICHLWNVWCSRGADKDEDEEDHGEEGYDVEGYDEEGHDEEGYDVEGYDVEGYDEEGYDVEGYDEEGYDEEGHDEEGYDMKKSTIKNKRT